MSTPLTTPEPVTKSESCRVDLIGTLTEYLSARAHGDRETMRRTGQSLNAYFAQQNVRTLVSTGSDFPVEMLRALPPARRAREDNPLYTALVDQLGRDEADFQWTAALRQLDTADAEAATPAVALRELVGVTGPVKAELQRQHPSHIVNERTTAFTGPLFPTVPAHTAAQLRELATQAAEQAHDIRHPGGLHEDYATAARLLMDAATILHGANGRPSRHVHRAVQVLIRELRRREYFRKYLSLQWETVSFELRLARRETAIPDNA